MVAYIIRELKWTDTFTFETYFRVGTPLQYSVNKYIVEKINYVYYVIKLKQWIIAIFISRT